jgi:hypothetical protein
MMSARFLTAITCLYACIYMTQATTAELPPEATEQWTPVPPSVSTPRDAPPSDAIALFIGKDASEWESIDGKPAKWQVTDGALIIEPGTRDIRTKRSFGDIQLHLEFRSPTPVRGEGQNRGNSGVYFMGLYELQVLDSYENKTYVNGQAASVYKQYPPLVNASRPPGEWQTYDVIFHAPRFAPNGAVTPARMTAFHNGVLVQNNVALRGPTLYKGKPSYAPHAPKLPLVLQDHGSAVAFRNIWVREISAQD